MRHFFILVGLSLIFCVTDNSGLASTENLATNNPALTGEAPEKNTPSTSSSFSTNHVSIPSSSSAISEEPPATATILPTENRVASLVTADLKEYAEQPEAVQQLIARGLALTNLNLSYKYGSSDPKEGGMDCSGTVYYLLHEAGLKDVPRDASGMYKWVWKQSRFQSVVSLNSDTFELDRLKPGDLLFWTGTYRVDRDPPVTHVMIYLGTNRHNDHRVMLGASEGRQFDGKSRYGVSVFDFKISSPNHKQSPPSATSPEAELEARFIGYGTIPGLEEIVPGNDSQKTNSP